MKPTGRVEEEAAGAGAAAAGMAAVAGVAANLTSGFDESSTARLPPIRSSPPSPPSSPPLPPTPPLLPLLPFRAEGETERGGAEGRPSVGCEADDPGTGGSTRSVALSVGRAGREEEEERSAAVAVAVA